MPVDAVGTTTNPYGQPPERATTDQLGTDTFLNLLVAQLKYQNPLSPSDGTEFLAQTAQFTMVEKLTQIAEQSDRLLQDNQALAAASLIGKTVSWADEQGEIRSGAVTGATFGSAGASVRIGEQTVPLALIRDVTASAEPDALP